MSVDGSFRLHLFEPFFFLSVLRKTFVSWRQYEYPQCFEMNSIVMSYECAWHSHKEEEKRTPDSKRNPTELCNNFSICECDIIAKPLLILCPKCYSVHTLNLWHAYVRCSQSGMQIFKWEFVTQKTIRKTRETNTHTKMNELHESWK